MKENGGSAFPFNSYVIDDTSGQGRHEGLEINPVMHSPGMSLRDWFAGMALQSLISATASDHVVGFTVTGNVVAAYQYAEAMLEERNK